MFSPAEEDSTNLTTTSRISHLHYITSTWPFPSLTVSIIIMSTDMIVELDCLHMTFSLKRVYVNFLLSIKDVKKTGFYSTFGLTVRDEHETVASCWPFSSTDQTVFVLGAHSKVKQSWVPAVSCK